MKKIIIAFLCFPLFLFSQNQVSVEFNKDVFYTVIDNTMYKTKNNLVTFDVSKLWQNESIGNYISGSLGLTFNPQIKEFKDGTIIKSPTFARVNVEAGKKITGFSSRVFDFNYIIAFSMFSDFGDKSRLKKPINFRVIPSLEIVLFNHVYISGSAYKTLIPISPTGLEIRSGLRFDF